jgi:hypothetical protein
MNISVPVDKFESSQIKVFFHAQNTKESSNLNFRSWVLCCIPPTLSEILVGLETHKPNKHFGESVFLPVLKVLHWKMHFTGHGYHFH